MSVPHGQNYVANGLFHHNSAFDYFFVQFLLPTWYQVLSPDDPFIASRNVKDRTYRMSNGSEVQFHAFLDPDNIKGWEAHIIWIDEGAQIGHGNNDLGYALWTAFITRLRAKPDAYPHVMYVSQNPSGHNWVWKVFIKPEPGSPQPLGDIGRVTVWGHDKAGKELKYHEWEKQTVVDGQTFTYYAIVAPSRANTHLRAGYIASMVGQMADQKGTRERLVEGMWTPINSLVYESPIFSPETHCIDYHEFLRFFEYDEIPPWLRVAVGIDCGGQKSPWAVEYYLQTEARDGYPPHWICFDEIYQIGETWNQIADLILDKQEQYRFKNIEYWIDPQSGNHKSGPTQVSIMEELLSRGIATDFPKGYNKYGAIDRVHTFMDRRPYAIPCPYKDDDMVINEDGTHAFVNGHCNLYYMSNVPGRHSAMNPEGHAAFFNLQEKNVFRYDNDRMREPKSSEEGLSPVQSTKIMDRDDHAQTAEFFWALGVNPLGPSERKRKKREPVDGPKNLYGTGTKRRRL